MSDRVSIDTGVGVSGCRGSVGIVSRSGVEVSSQGSKEHTISVASASGHWSSDPQLLLATPLIQKRFSSDISQVETETLNLIEKIR